MSTSDGRQDTTNQLAQLQQFAQSQNLNVTKIYRDTASGKSDKRESFQQMLEDASQKRFDAILFWALDRFSREGAFPTLRYLQNLTDWGIGYRSFTEQYLDSCGIFKDAVVSILATIAKQERIRLSERTKAGQARARAAGQPGPAGYYNPGQPSAEQRRPGTTAKIIALRNSGKSFAQIAKSVKLSKTAVQRIYAQSQL